MSKVEVDQVDPQSGTTLTLGTSGDTVSIPSGVTLANAGTVTGISASAINSGTIATARLGSGTASSSTFLRGDQTYAEAGGGKIGQVVTTTKTDIWSQSTSGNTFYQPTGFSRTITPTATSSKILIMTTASFSGTIYYEFAGKILRQIGGSDAEILIGDAAGSRARTFMSKRTNQAQDFANFSMTVLDSPNTTSEITYRVMGATEDSATLYLNRGASDSDNSGEWRTASNIVCMEVLA